MLWPKAGAQLNEAWPGPEDRAGKTQNLPLVGCVPQEITQRLWARVVLWALVKVKWVTVSQLRFTAERRGREVLHLKSLEETGGLSLGFCLFTCASLYSVQGLAWGTVGRVEKGTVLLARGGCAGRFVV
jgi:hypothetical protein